MKYLLPALLLVCLSAHAADAPADLLRFTNGDRLDGTFAGLKAGPTILWKRGDVDLPVEFKATQLRQAVLRGGRAAKSFQDFSSIGLTNGDRIPGTLVAINASDVTIETAFAGALVVPRNRVGMIAPNPLGGKMLYNGPFSEEGWSVVAPAEEVKGAPAPIVQGLQQQLQKQDGEPEKVLPWTYSSGSYYSRNGTSALVRDVGMPDRAMMKFRVAWKSRLSLAIAFHADLTPAPKPKPDAANPQNPQNVQLRQEFGSSQNYPKMFGNAYVLNLYSSYMILYRCGYDKDGKPNMERVQSGATNIRLSESGDASVELRCNRLTGDISLFLNDEFAMQWTESVEANGGTYAGRGGGIGFQSQGSGSQVRISDLVVAEWNGMPDAARSLQTDDQDIILLTNGTDRFSGEVSGLSGDKIQLKGRYGNFEFPLREIAEIRFAKNRLAKSSEPPNDAVTVRFQPFGKISGTPSPSEPGAFALNSALAGKMTINLDYAVMLDFKNTNSFLDDWDPEF